MADYLVISEERQKLIAEATKQDKTLEQLLGTSCDFNVSFGCFSPYVWQTSHLLI
jgi:hypothetical protein